MCSLHIAKKKNGKPNEDFPCTNKIRIFNNFKAYDHRTTIGET